MRKGQPWGCPFLCCGSVVRRVRCVEVTHRYWKLSEILPDDAAQTLLDGSPFLGETFVSRLKHGGERLVAYSEQFGGARDAAVGLLKCLRDELRLELVDGAEECEVLLPQLDTR